jgi:hypothetical protein
MRRTASAIVAASIVSIMVLRRLQSSSCCHRTLVPYGFNRTLRLFLYFNCRQNESGPAPTYPSGPKQRGLCDGGYRTNPVPGR